MPPNRRTRRKPFILACFLALLRWPDWGLAETTNLLPVADTSLIEPFPTNNFGGANVLLAGTGENLLRHRALMQFDVAGQLPPLSKIKNASLTLELAWLPNNGY